MPGEDNPNWVGHDLGRALEEAFAEGEGETVSLEIGDDYGIQTLLYKSVIEKLGYRVVDRSRDEKRGKYILEVARGEARAHA